MFENYTDSELFNTVKAGDEQALTLLFIKHYQQLYRFMFVFIPENEIALELTANLSINLWENKKKIVLPAFESKFI
jgi:hypothetical protein